MFANLHDVPFSENIRDIPTILHQKLSIKWQILFENKTLAKIGVDTSENEPLKVPY